MKLNKIVAWLILAVHAAAPFGIVPNSLKHQGKLQQWKEKKIGFPTLERM